ncbi:MAG: NADH-quinone oxidoreductase subunit NuoE [Desulfobacteraceae bacterium]|nr:NADH-quinone oxidoreductase subunit NuoE [Desulfobacteraceae bacterium]
MERSTLEVQLAEDTPVVEKALSEIQTEFEGRSDELIPMLQRVQRTLGYLPERALVEIAHLTRLPTATVFGVATFYEQFRFHPAGKHIIRVCRGTACHVRGSDRILEDIETRFQLAPGGTSDDNLFTLETVACFGSCALAPVVLVDDSVKGRMNPAKTREALEGIQEKANGAETDKSITKR